MDWTQIQEEKKICAHGNGKLEDSMEATKCRIIIFPSRGQVFKFGRQISLCKGRSNNVVDKAPAAGF